MFFFTIFVNVLDGIMHSESVVQVQQNYFDSSIDESIVFLAVMVTVIIAIIWSIKSFKIFEFNKKTSKRLKFIFSAEATDQRQC